MHSTLIQIAGYEVLEGFENNLSFRPLLECLKSRLEDDWLVKTAFYRFVLEQFEKSYGNANEIDVNKVEQYSELLGLVYTILAPLIADENEFPWALSTPVPGKIFFSTNAFYKFITAHNLRAGSEDNNYHPLEKIQQRFIYRVVLKRFYNFVSVIENKIIYTYTEAGSGINRYYSIHTNDQFIDIQVKGVLPKLNFDLIGALIHEGKEVDLLSDLLPLSQFSFKGFSVITLKDVTLTHAIENIREAIVSHTDQKEAYRETIGALESLAGSNHIKFGLLPFLTINDNLVFNEDEYWQSIVINSGRKLNTAEKIFYSLAEEYKKNPAPIFISEITSDKISTYPFLEVLLHAGINSYCLLPVYYHKNLVGVLEIYSRQLIIPDEVILSRLEDAMPLLGQLLQQSIEQFHNTIDVILKDKFTALQPSVQWKFNKAAWHYFKHKQVNKDAPEIETVEFKNVYPLFGAVDIRDSTTERNHALQEDLKILLTTLSKTLQSLRQYVHLDLMDKLIFNCEEWMERIRKYITTNDEIMLGNFLETEVNPFLSHIKSANPATQNIIDTYQETIAGENGSAFEHRRNLEEDIQMINLAISNHLEKDQQLLQESYPCYFSKFRTDGLEYDIYIGQSIVPAVPFDLLYLKNIRLWQLRAMSEIARITRDLAPQLHRPLYTTQLIFIHSRSIDISFRNDERRFDVEGSYNIRYEVIKKRIDKVLIKGTNERLTQPGKIALVYFNAEEAREYMEYIQYLQEEEFLQNDLEYLDLEELQGVSGLRAFRIGV
jgi:hypothetical protein